MNKRHGKIIEFKDGSLGIAYNDEQEEAFTKYKRIFIRLINQDGTPKTDEMGKKICSLKRFEEVKVIGFIN